MRASLGKLELHLITSVVPEHEGALCALLLDFSEVSGHENKIWEASDFGKECHKGEARCGWDGSLSQFPFQFPSLNNRGDRPGLILEARAASSSVTSLVQGSRVGESLAGRSCSGSSWAWETAPGARESPQAPSCTLPSLPHPNPSHPCVPPELAWDGQILFGADLTPQSCFGAKLHPDASRKPRELQQPGVILGPSALPRSCLKTQTLGISRFY